MKEQKPSGGVLNIAVVCPNCPHRDVVSSTVSGRLVWVCGWCGNVWTPSAADVFAYNAHARERDRL